MDDCITHLTPSQAWVKLLIHAGSPLSASDTAYFRCLVGCLQYLTFTWPDIAYSVNTVCQFLHSPTDVHLNAAKRILRYIKGTLNYVLFFRKGASIDKHVSFQVDLKAYCDADWARDPNDQKSTTSFVVLLNNTPAFWCSKKQTAVSQSTTEAEYHSIVVTHYLRITVASQSS